MNECAEREITPRGLSERSAQVDAERIRAPRRRSDRQRKAWQGLARRWRLLARRRVFRRDRSSAPIRRESGDGTSYPAAAEEMLTDVLVPLLGLVVAITAAWVWTAF
jgi:hypothetical protein